MKSREIIFRQKGKSWFFTACALLLCAPAHAQSIGPESGRPMPRFETLRFDTVRMRRGPGREHSIAWLYQRKGMPMEVFKEYGEWRQVRDALGDAGWISASQLSGARSGLVQVAGTPLLRRTDPESRVIARAEMDVVLKLRECVPDWCYGSAQGYGGWVSKAALWGVYPDEMFDGD